MPAVLTTVAGGPWALHGPPRQRGSLVFDVEFHRRKAPVGQDLRLLASATASNGDAGKEHNRRKAGNYLASSAVPSPVKIHCDSMRPGGNLHEQASPPRF